MFSGIHLEKIIPPILAAAILLTTEISCSKKITQQNKTTEVTAAAVIEKNIPYRVPVVGQIMAKQHVQLQARVAGFLEKLNFIEGSYVKGGQLLYQIQKDQWIAERDEAQAAVLKSQAFYDNALIEYNRQKNLWSTNATSKKDLDNATQNKYVAEASLFNSKAQLVLAKLNLSYTDIYAPFDGRIGASYYYPGNMLNISSKPLAEVVMIDPIWVEYEISEQTLLNILQDKNSNSHMPNAADPTFHTTGATAKLILSNGTEYSETGIIDFVNNQADPQTGTIQMRATFRNPQQLLLPGNYVNVILEKTRKDSALLIPQIAMQNDQIGTYVFTINKDSIVEQKYIEIGQVYGSYIEVKTGLKKDELVISDGILRVKNGSKVSYKVAQSNIMALPEAEPAKNEANTVKDAKVPSL